MFDSHDGTSHESTLTSRQLQVLAVVRDHLARFGYPPTVREIGSSIGVASSSTVHAHLAALERAGAIQRDPSKPRALKVAQPYAVEAGVAVPAGGSGLTDVTNVRQLAREQSDPPSAFDGSSALAGDNATADLHRIAGGAPAVVPPPGSATERDDVRSLPLVGNVAAGQPMLAEEQVDELVAVPAYLARGRDHFVLRISGESMVKAGILDGDLVVVRRQHVAEQGQIVIALVEDEATCKRLAFRDGHVWLDPENDAFAPIPGDGVRILGIVTGLMRSL